MEIICAPCINTLLYIGYLKVPQLQCCSKVPIPPFPPPVSGILARTSVPGLSFGLCDIYNPYLRSLPTYWPSDRTSVPGLGSGPCRFSADLEVPSPAPWTGWSLWRPYLPGRSPIQPRMQRPTGTSFCKLYRKKNKLQLYPRDIESYTVDNFIPNNSLVHMSWC